MNAATAARIDDLGREHADLVDERDAVKRISMPPSFEQLRENVVSLLSARMAVNRAVAASFVEDVA